MSVDHECRRVIFHGRVQGVGFRYTADRIARGHLVTGFVRNLVDGTVELVACGTSFEVDRFLKEVMTYFAENITSTHDDRVDYREFAGFEIRR
ncbi:acylphosphatase [bacterium]|nr:acylphosphatase [bacterium]